MPSRMRFTTAGVSLSFGFTNRTLLVMMVSSRLPLGSTSSLGHLSHSHSFIAIGKTLADGDAVLDIFLHLFDDRVKFRRAEANTLRVQYAVRPAKDNHAPGQARDLDPLRLGRVSEILLNLEAWGAYISLIPHRGAVLLKVGGLVPSVAAFSPKRQRHWEL